MNNGGEQDLEQRRSKNQLSSPNPSVPHAALYALFISQPSFPYPAVT